MPKGLPQRTASKGQSTAKALVRVDVERLPHGEDLPLPSYQSEQAAGLDLLAAVPWEAPLTLLPGSRTLVPTGLKIALPEGYEAQVRPRSGLALKSGITVLNTPGTIDADYRGEVGVVLVNLGGAPFEVRRGERIAQLVVAPVTQAQLVEVASLDETARGEGGFGSTGKSAGTALSQGKSAKAKPAVARKKVAPKTATAKARTPTAKPKQKQSKAAKKKPATKPAKPRRK